MRQRIQLTRTNRSEAYPYVLGRRESVSVFSFEGTSSYKVRYSEKLLDQLLKLYPEKVFCLDSSMVEHAAVNRGVAGSSPARGARQRSRCYRYNFGSVVKRLRHRPFTAVTRVQFPSESSIIKCASAHLMMQAFFESLRM